MASLADTSQNWLQPSPQTPTVSDTITAHQEGLFTASKKCIPHYFNRCQKGTQCNYLHDSEHSVVLGQYPPWYHARPPCRRWMVGDCHYGLQCQYRHPPERAWQLPEHSYWKSLEAIFEFSPRDAAETGHRSVRSPYETSHLISKHQVNFLIAEMHESRMGKYNPEEVRQMRNKLKRLLREQEWFDYKDKVLKLIQADEVFAGKNANTTPDFIDLHKLPVEAALEKLHTFVKSATKLGMKTIKVCTGHHSGPDGLCHLVLAVEAFAEAHNLKNVEQHKNQGIQVLKLASLEVNIFRSVPLSIIPKSRLPVLARQLDIHLVTHQAPA